MIWWQSSEPCEPSPSALLQAALQEAQRSRDGAVLTQHHRHSNSARLIPLMGALGPHCNSASGARELGNITAALHCVMHAGTWWNMNREGKSWLPVVCSSHITSAGSGLYPSRLLLAWGFPPPYGFIPQLGSSHPIHCNFYSSSKLFCNCYKWKNKR